MSANLSQQSSDIPDLSGSERRSLRAQAHALDAVVSISQNGLSASVMKEIDHCLTRHELIKIRVYNDDRAERDAYMEKICTELVAAPVQHIGKLLVIFRHNPDKERASENKVKLANKPRGPRRTKRSFQND